MSKQSSDSKSDQPKEEQCLCVKCKQPIPKERVEALPDTQTCVKCSDVQPIHGDSRYGDLIIGKTKEEIRRMRLRYE